MKIFKAVVVALAMSVFASSVNAQVAGTISSIPTAFDELSSAGLNGGAVASLSGGMVLTNAEVFAAMPSGYVYGGTFLAAGTTTGEAVLTFMPGTRSFGFLWGSPDGYNVLTVTTSLGSVATFYAADFGLWDSSASEFVQFKTLGVGESIDTVTFGGGDSFEVASFSSAVPEPAAWGMMILGLGAAGGMVRRRRHAMSMAQA